LNNKTISIFEHCTKFFAYFILVVIAVLLITALFTNPTDGEANVGSFDVTMFNEDWTMEINGETSQIDLPFGTDAEEGTIIILRNFLPDNIEGKYSLCTRTTVADMSVYINDELREEYCTDENNGRNYYLQSAYIVTELTSEDAGAEVEIWITVKSTVTLNTVFIASGNGVWFQILKENILLNITSIIVLVLGVILLILYFAGRKRLSGYKQILYLGFVMLDMSAWMLSESRLRQIFFSNPSLTDSFSYLTIELLGALVLFYFDEVQHRKYHKFYVTFATLLTGQLFINILLDRTGVVYMYRTLFLSHIWTVISIILCITTTIIDIIKKRVHEYLSTAIGMLIFLLFSVEELIAFYTTTSKAFGFYVCLGLIGLLLSTFIQLLYDENKRHLIIQQEQERSIISTIETITSAIDAKDEYTGGHSQRVGAYAQILAREMAKEYDFTEDDIQRIHYIGLVHDIGKIGVADPILNKPGKLTEEEFNLMKEHTNIGYELMTALGDNVKGLLDGIRYHHERYDGSGYPKGLMGKEIPLEARILCLADCYDAMTSNRVYRKRLTDEDVIKEINRCAGSQFDPNIAKIFTHLLEHGEIVATTVEGMETDNEGKVYLSSILEYRLSKDLSNGISITNPTFIRMLCYLIKIAEKNNRRAFVSFVSLKDNKPDIIHKKNQDISVTYTEDTVIYALFDWTEEQEATLPDIIKSGKLK